MIGLSSTSGSVASLLLNLEAVLTAVIAWVVFKENAGSRVVLGMLAVVAGAKGLTAGLVNCSLALAMGFAAPEAATLLSALAVGFLGYGLSLVLFVVALRELGTARTGAYFSTAPFIGALAALWLLGESASMAFWAASALMGLGVWLHLTERHEHEHTHEPPTHKHPHYPDVHHRHRH